MGVFESGLNAIGGNLATTTGIKDYAFLQQMQLTACGSASGMSTFYGQPIVTPKRRRTMFENVKDYIGKHRDIIFTLGLVIIVDHFLFKGALRERIKGTIEGILSKAEGMIQQKDK